MREKFRIGDGKSIEKSSIGTAQQGVSQYNDGSSLMFETGQAFFNPNNNIFQGHKFHMSEQRPYHQPVGVSAAAAQLTSKTILSMQSSSQVSNIAVGGGLHSTAIPREQNFQI